MSQLTMVGVDIVAVAILTLGLYFPRHRRRDLLVAYLVVNIGVMAVAITLAGSTAALGLGLGLFGVLSIIRLRSTEIDQREVAYYFSALALGLIAGLAALPSLLALLLMTLIVLTVAVGDHPRLFGRYRQQTVLVDRAIPDEAALRVHVADLLGAQVRALTVRELNLVNDTTLVDVRFTVSARAHASASPARREPIDA